MLSVQPQALVSLEVRFYLEKQQSDGKLENSQLQTGIWVINCSSRLPESSPAQTHHIHMHLRRFLLG